MSALTIVRRIVAVLAFMCALVVTVHAVGELNRVKVLKTDLAEINDIRYGLMNAEEWVARVAEILERRITEFEVTDANRPQLRQAIARALDQVLVTIEDYLRARAAPRSGDFWGNVGRGLQRLGQKALLDIEELRPQVHEYADLILDELSRPETRRALKDQLVAFLNQATSSAFSPTDRSELNAIMQRYGCNDPATCSAYLSSWIAQAERPLLLEQITLYGLVVFIFGMLLLAREPEAAARQTCCSLNSFNLALLTSTTLLLLAGGVLTPMIEIDARISEFTMQLMGETINFSNQVLYFQSKSVFDVVSILARTGSIDMIFVAALLVTFSVIFPLLKVLAGYLYYYNERAARSGVVRFFALRSAKWSMADVFVIAIFMAYIGFSGLVGSQLGALSRAARPVELLTTNGTILAGGFFLFVAFVLASLLLSTVLEKCGKPDRLRDLAKHPSRVRAERPRPRAGAVLPHNQAADVDLDLGDLTRR
jgi:hypothetical protein